MQKPLKNPVRLTIFPLSRRHSCPICQTHWKYQLHGFHQYLLFDSPVARAIWKCLIFLLFLLALYYSVYLLNDYVDRRVVTLNTIHQVKRLHFPNITICPKHADALNFSAIEKDLHFRLPHLSAHQSNQLITFAMAGAGFQHFDSYTQLMKKSEVEEMAKLFRRWRGERGKLEFFRFIFETNGFTCEELFQSCLYGKRKIPCCDLFNPTYVMLRGRCFKMRKFAQTAPDEAGKLTLFFNQMASPFLDRDGIQRQVVAYLSQKEDIPTFPRFYLNDHFWYRLRLKKRRITMLMPNPHCSPTRHLKKGNCYVEAWLRERVIHPFNCTIFYMAHKTPELEICDPEIIFLNYRSVINVISNRSAYQNLTKCLPACERDIIDTQLYSKQFQDQRSSTGAKNAYYHLEASYENLQVEIYEEKLTTTLPGFISQIGGQLSFFLGMSSISLLQFFMLPIGNFIVKTLSSVRRKFSVKPE